MSRISKRVLWKYLPDVYRSASQGQLIASAPHDEAINQEKNALVAIYATRHLKDLLRETGDLSISKFTLKGTPLGLQCSRRKSAHVEYRPLDGSCNGFEGANYGDDVQDIRRSVHRNFILPSPRLISTTVIHYNKTIECCSFDGTNLSPRYVHPLCAQISVPFDDPFYSELFVRCIPYVRSVSTIRSDCSFGPREQLNQATHCLDGSHIYGVDNAKLNQLRQFRNGLLRYSGTSSRMFLPKSSHPMNDCQYDDQNGTCYISGDTRVNMVPQLTLLHTLWLREHNRLATKLKWINAHWNDEKLFQEARRIVIATVQHITYGEWLPIILGSNAIDKPDFPTKASEVDPRTSNSFATAAIKFFNSLFDDYIGTYDHHRKLQRLYILKDYFNKPNILEDNFNGLIRGLATQESLKLDLNYVDSIKNHLFQSKGHGYDAISLDIQRGRDHGLPTYTSFRSLIGYPNVTEFSELEDVIPMKHLNLLREVYKSPEDIDVLVGGMAEKPLRNSLLGPTFSYIIREQMMRTKNAFTDAQLREIQKVTLARIFCDNSDDIKFMQLNVFKQITGSNPLLSCLGNDIPHLNLKPWMSTDQNVGGRN
ncbi:hypothetical protein RI129_001936 [Pyrocoelia pectoralis]|uniref:Peroxidase n=1 Tax=Pyrocoelia pectoralis TaxID=417401 RepID=A0AAN7VLG8_9COLE